MITAICILVIVLSAGSAICSWKAMKDAEIDLKESRKRSWKEEGDRINQRKESIDSGLDGILEALKELNNALDEPKKE